MIVLDCIVQENRQLAEDIFSLWLTFEVPVACAPGQFLHVLCGEGQLLRRPISICDAAPGRLRLVFQRKGAGTAWLAQRRAGEHLDVLPPRGHGFDCSGRILLAGGGIGVPPMLLAAKRAGSAAAVLGFKTRASLILQEELQAVCESVDITTEDGSFGQKGFLTLPLEAQLQAGGFDRGLACGPRPMLRAVNRAAEKYRVPCFVSMEERMGCGIGACLVCACSVGGHLQHVCKDGPVFDGSEVDWDA